MLSLRLGRGTRPTLTGNPSNDQESYGPLVREPLLGVSWAYPNPFTRKKAALRAIATLDNPRDRGQALTGILSGLWRYRVGDYRVVCDLQDAHLIVLVIDIDHRNSIYE
ncbi:MULTISPECIES: type II toxin-antitoxin system RelE/ParE family toxin [unclassified Cryobacterium]|uniref:type II toxin-antitoxin system RelE family toxin n=1 Tax=unclassified Cryobacterium TaxID=2649013 RepID=UPI001069D113|nr:MULTISPECIES: type II toxin-antitoxin system RelE/ParE family toxin [unclassified Cryobacterium]TFD03790.1 type II toxin-antitoxin system RelE/ParE family toxin [Cryobacterium sp. TMT1-66-1]TFD11483.1 type II toxin-antitoxin system RelE/ParE family toxin [Cryobacterium sp. TMT1-2-2]